MSIQQLSVASGVSERTIYSFWSSLNRPPGATLEKLAIGLKVPHWFIVYCFDTKFIPQRMEQIKQKINAVNGDC